MRAVPSETDVVDVCSAYAKTLCQIRNSDDATGTANEVDISVAQPGSAMTLAARMNVPALRVAVGDIICLGTLVHVIRVAARSFPFAMAGRV